MTKIRKTIALLLALAIVTITTTSGASAAVVADNHGDGEEVAQTIALQNAAETGIMPLRDSHYFTIGAPNANIPVNVYTAPTLKSPLSGLVTVNVLNFNAILYQVDIWVYNKSGLLWHEDNWTKLGDSNVFTAVNVTAIDIRIAPRAGLITPQRAFTVEVIY